VASSSPPKPTIITPVVSALRSLPQAAGDEPTKCERCGADMYRMHAVWRCPNCRFKTDCCGW
jgi:predicted Zn-ribbon and HTH transcriptional regulator